MFKKEIFRAYDIRGKYGEEFDDDFAENLGKVFSTYLGAKNIVVARDMRGSSNDLAGKVIEGVNSAGCNVVDIGMASTPLFYFSVIESGADGGIMVTASHLGEEFNGFKVTREKAIAIGGDELFKSAEDLFKNPPGSSNERGSREQKQFLDKYIESSIEHSGLKPGEIDLKVKLTGNELVLKEIKSVLDELNIEVVEGGEDISFEFDADGDRVIVYSGNGEKIRGDLLGGLFAGHYFSGKSIAYDLRYSIGVLEYLESKDIKPVPTRIGHTLIKRKMREDELEFCGEQSGHLFFKEMGYVESPAFAVLKILKLVKDKNENIAKLADEVSGWSTTNEINFELESREKIKELLEKAKQKYSDGKLNEMDGVKIEYPDWGFILRPSNTEAKLRLIVDAKTHELMEEKKEEVVNILQ